MAEKLNKGMAAATLLSLATLFVSLWQNQETERELRNEVTQWKQIVEDDEILRSLAHAEVIHWGDSRMGSNWVGQVFTVVTNDPHEVTNLIRTSK